MCSSFIGIMSVEPISMYIKMPAKTTTLPFHKLILSTVVRASHASFQPSMVIVELVLGNGINCTVKIEGLAHICMGKRTEGWYQPLVV